MQIDLTEVPDLQSFISVPEGVYVCRIAEVRAGVTRDGSPRWAMRLEVADGEFAGRTAAWDALNWSERGLPRAKAVLERLGYDVSSTLELEPEDLVGRRVEATLVAEERVDPVTGQRIENLKVPYMGYEPAPAAAPF